jgi:hypothetical protein
MPPGACACCVVGAVVQRTGMRNGRVYGPREVTHHHHIVVEGGRLCVCGEVRTVCSEPARAKNGGDGMMPKVPPCAFPLGLQSCCCGIAFAEKDRVRSSSGDRPTVSLALSQLRTLSPPPKHHGNPPCALLSDCTCFCAQFALSAEERDPKASSRTSEEV